MQRMRLLHAGLPVRRGRPRPHRRSGRASARSATTAWRTGWSPRAPRLARPTRSSSGPTRSSSRTPSGAWPSCTGAAMEGAYLYGAGDEPEHDLAGGLGAFFLLTEPPERFGLPAEAESPVQENLVAATAAAVGRRVARGGRRRGGVRDPHGGAGERRRRRPARAALRAARAEPTRSPGGRARPHDGADDTGTRDARALGTRGEPASWRPAVEGRTWPSRSPRGATRPGRSSTGPTPDTATSSQRRGKSRRRTGGCVAGATPDDLRGPIHQAAGVGLARAALLLGRRHGLGVGGRRAGRAISRATSGRPPSRARSRSAACCRRRRC